MKNSEKIKWSRLRTQLTLHEIFNHLQENFVIENDKGYSDIEILKKSCSAIYNEKINNSVVTLDRFGNEFEQEVVEFYSVKFQIIQINNSTFLLSLINPPKTLKPFIDFLTVGLNYKIGVSNVELDVGVFLDKLTYTEGISLLKIKKVKVNSAVISDAAKATIEVTSKNNAIEDMSLLLDNKKFVVDKIKITCLVNNKQTELELSRAGSFSSSPDFSEKMEALLLPQILNNI